VRSAAYIEDPDLLTSSGTKCFLNANDATRLENLPQPQWESRHFVSSSLPFTYLPSAVSPGMVIIAAW
jgi:hypothetical protein